MPQADPKSGRTRLPPVMVPGPGRRRERNAERRNSLTLRTAGGPSGWGRSLSPQAGLIIVRITAEGKEMEARHRPRSQKELHAESQQHPRARRAGLGPDRRGSRDRGTGLSAGMAPPLLPLLLLASVVTVHGVDLTYTPQITTQPIQGKLTTTTFSLEVPTCVFNGYPQDAIWLVISFINATVNVPKPITGIAPYSQFSTRGYYMALRTYGRDFDCPAPVGDVRFIRVGANTTCVHDMSVQDCNGPLPASASLRVMYVGINDSNVETVRTRWSEVITLPTAKQPSTIDTWPGGRSGGMIVITTILSVLVAILLACLIGAIAAGAKTICWRKQLSSPEQVAPEEDEHKRYSSHHVPQQFLQQFQQQQIPPHV